MFNWLKLILFVSILSSCGKKDFFNEDKSIIGGTWDSKTKLEFAVEIKDTLSFYDFYIDFRHNDSYEYADIYLFFDVQFPNGKMANDTIHYVMQDFAGKWYGKNSGSVIENHVLIKPKTRFPMNGIYKMTIAHAMRDEKLVGIEDVGLIITKKE